MNKSLPSIPEALSAGWPSLVWECRGDISDYNNYESQDTLPTIAEVQQVRTDLVRTCVIDSLSETCEQYIMAGFVSSALGTPHFYDAELADQINLMGGFLITLTGAGIPYAVRNINTGLKEYREHTQAQMTQVLADGAQWKLYYLNLFHQKRNYITSIPHSDTAVDEIVAVTWDSVEE